MSKRYKARRRFRYFVQRLKCQQCGEDNATACYLPEPYSRDRMPDEMLCAVHAGRAGYCRSCGDFWGGIESFEFLHPGLCDNCDDQIRADFGTDDREHYEEEYWEAYEA